MRNLIFLHYGFAVLNVYGRAVGEDRQGLIFGVPESNIGVDF